MKAHLFWTRIYCKQKRKKDKKKNIPDLTHNLNFDLNYSYAHV